MTQRPSTLRRAVDARLGLVAADDPAGQAWVVRVPFVVGFLLLVCLVSLIALDALPNWREARLSYGLGLVPARVLAGGAGEVSLGAALGPLITHQFLHGGWWHLGLNTLGLVLFGTGVARRLGADGAVPGAAGTANRVVFLAFFLACGVAGGLTYVLLEPGSARPLIGASGAVSGLMGAAMRFALRRFAPYGVGEGPLAPVLSAPILFVTVTYVATNAVAAFGIGLPGVPAGAIGWHAHIGGYLFGVLTFPFYDRLATRRGAYAA